MHQSRLSTGEYGELLYAAKLIEAGLCVFRGLVDDRGIDLLVRLDDNRFVDIQVKTVSNFNYVYMRKVYFSPRPNLFLALVRLRDQQDPEFYLIPFTVWLCPDDLFVSRDYMDKKSAPEFGIQLSQARLNRLQPHRFNRDSVVDTFDIATRSK